ncbi:MAG: hypoxanthine phosphoribosyltransferase [Candidatus Geothermincolia bacterium]
MAKFEIEETVFTQDEIQGRVRELAREINKDYAEEGVLLVGILKGAFIFLADLARNLTIPVQFDFIACSSYGSATRTSGVVRILKDLDCDIESRHVLIVEDIIDTGLTLSYLLKNLEARGPASLEICSLLNKPSVEGKVDLPIKYEGFSIPDVFVVGYGLDYDQNYRNLPYIARLKK